MSIRSKLISYSVLIAIIPVVITAFLSFKKAEIAIRNKTIEHLQTATTLKEGEINLWMREIVSSLNILQKVTQNELDRKGESYHSEETHERINRLFDELLNNLKSQHPEFQEIFLVDAVNGSVYLSTDKTQITKIKQSQSFFIRGREGIYIQSFYYSTSLGEMSTIVSAPIKNNLGQTIYVIAARANMNTLNQIMFETNGLGSTGETYLVNSFNQAITPLKFENLKSSLGIYTEGVRNCVQENSGTGLYPDYRNVPVIGAYRWLHDYHICIVAEIDESEALKDVKPLQRIVFITASIILSLAILIGLLTALTFTRPINKLISIAKSISKGNFHKEVDKNIIQEKNEIGLLALTLDRMQQELKRTLSEMKSVIETMPSALFLLKKDGAIELANDSAQKLLGYSASELIGSPFDKYLDESNTLTKLKKIQRKKVNGENELRIISKSNEKINVSISIAKLKARKNYSGGLIVVVQDIRELKRYAKKRIDEITPILNQISLGDFSASLDLPNRDDEFTDLIVSVNLMANNLQELISENREKTQEIEKSQRKLASSHRRLLKAKDTIEGEKAKAEALLGSIGEGILAADSNGKVILMNIAAESMFGINTSEAVGKTFLDCCEFLDGKGNKISLNKSPIKDVIRKNKIIHLITFHKKLSGHSTPLSTTFAPILQGEKSVGLVATFRDISKEKEVDQAKTEFVSLASHQLRTPLTAIKWIIEELLRSTSFTKHQRDYLNDALKSNARMIGLVNDLLNVSRLETGNISVESVKTDIGEIFQQVLKEAKPLSFKKKQKLDFIKPAKRIIVKVDPQLLRQIISNLVSNAIKYSDDKTNITVKLQQKKTKVMFSVSDQGIGIPKKQQSRLFQKFFRTGEAIKRSTSGSGLGLYIIKKVINSMHGDITFESKEGKGTIFSVSLPLKGPIKKGDVKKLIEHRVS